MRLLPLDANLLFWLACRVEFEVFRRSPHRIGELLLTSAHRSHQRACMPTQGRVGVWFAKNPHIFLYSSNWTSGGKKARREHRNRSCRRCLWQAVACARSRDAFWGLYTH